MMILTEEDLRTLNLPLGPFRRLIVAIDERKVALKNPGAIVDSRLQLNIYTYTSVLVPFQDEIYFFGEKATNKIYSK